MSENIQLRSATKEDLTLVSTLLQENQLPDRDIYENSGKEEILEMYEGIEIPTTIPYRLANKSEYDLEYLLISQSV